MKAKRTLAALMAALGGAIGCGPSDEFRATGSTVMVTSEDRRAVYIVSPDDDAIARVHTVHKSSLVQDLPGEPTRIARIADRVLVTLRTHRRVQELRDFGAGFEELRSIEVGAEPYGIVASADGQRAYVTESIGGRVLELDGTSLEILRVWELTGEPRWLALHPSGHRLFVAGFAPGRLYTIDLLSGAVRRESVPRAWASEQPMTPRITGDIAASTDGGLVAVPMLYLAPDLVIDRSAPPEPSRPRTGYGGVVDPRRPPTGEERLVPAVLLIETDDKGRPGASSLIRLPTDRGGGYPSSVSFSPGSDVVYATMEGAGVVASTLVDGPLLGVEHGFERRVFSRSQLVAGARAVSFHDDEAALVFGFLDRAVADLPLAIVTALAPGSHPPSDSTKVIDRRLRGDLEEGRRLFYTSVDRMVTNPAGSLSCATCHFDGRDDGLTWVFDDGPRQTPSLAGRVSAREPVRWTGDIETAAEDALETSRLLMGGTGFSRETADKMAAYMDAIREVDVPHREGRDAQILRGRALFEREDVGCAECHFGPELTDNQTHTIGSFEGVRTPTLRGIMATPPYLHDGAALDLRDLLELSSALGMGQTSHLEPRELDDLEAYLRSL